MPLNREQEEVAQQPFGGHIVQPLQYTIPTTTQPAEFLELLEEFNTAFQHGIREVVIDKKVYVQLYTYFSMYQQAAQTLDRSTPFYLTINTPGGPILIRPEGSPNGSQIDFDKYMEDVNENAP